MFRSDDLIYIQLQKTGTTTIAALLMKLFDGVMIGQHNPATPEQLKTIPNFISSIRNPWSWYLSLWAFGVQNGGGFMRRLTMQTHKNPNRVISPAADIDEADLPEDVRLWRSVYDSSDNVESFRHWLRMIHDPANAHRLGEGYGNTSICQNCGFMTYRYLYLCCTNLEDIMNIGELYSYESLVDFDNKNCYIDHFVRQEALEDSLCEVLEHIRPLSDEDRALIYGAGRSNTSRKTLTISDYYDDESTGLVLSRDRLIVDKFGYEPPV